MKVKLQEGKQLAHDALTAMGYRSDRGQIISQHLLDSQMRGYPSAGFARILSIRDRLDGRPPADSIEITRESPVSAQYDGRDTVGYLVAEEATEKAIEKAKKMGIAIVGVSNTWYTGMLSYYAEMAAKEGLVSILASNATPWVAPHGGYKSINGTNPFCVGFPSSETPIIYDVGTSKILHADVLLAQRLGTKLPPDSAFDSNGNSTINPWDVFDGSIAPWGGHKGTGLATVVQLLGVLAGSPAFPPDLAQFGFTIITINPELFRPMEDFRREIDDYCKRMRDSPAVAGGSPLRMPFERSSNMREDALRVGEVEVDENIYQTLHQIVNKSRI